MPSCLTNLCLLSIDFCDFLCFSFVFTQQDGEPVEYSITETSDGRSRAVNVTGPMGAFVQGAPRRSFGRALGGGIAAGFGSNSSSGFGYGASSASGGGGFGSTAEYGGDSGMSSMSLEDSSTMYELPTMPRLEEDTDNSEYTTTDPMEDTTNAGFGGFGSGFDDISEEANKNEDETLEVEDDASNSSTENDSSSGTTGTTTV